MKTEKCLDVGMGVCFWCGEPFCITIGKQFTTCDKQYDKKYLFVGYEPCDKCKKDMEKGLTIIEVQDKPITTNQPEIQKEIYPTSQWWVVDKNSEFAKEYSKGYDKIFIDSEAAIKIGLKGENSESTI